MKNPSKNNNKSPGGSYPMRVYVTPEVVEGMKNIKTSGTDGNPPVWSEIEKLFMACMPSGMSGSSKAILDFFKEAFDQHTEGLVEKLEKAKRVNYLISNKTLDEAIKIIKNQ